MPFSQTNELCILDNTLYGILRIPCHWLDNITRNTRATGLNVSPHDPCVYMGTLKPEGDPIYIGLYNDDFFYCSNSNNIEEQFRESIS